MSPGAGSESVVRAELCCGSRGEASSRSHTVLLQALQRPRPVVAGRQHCLRLQGQPSYLSAGWFHIKNIGTVVSTLSCVSYCKHLLAINCLPSSYFCRTCLNVCFSSLYRNVFQKCYRMIIIYVLSLWAKNLHCLFIFLFCVIRALLDQTPPPSMLT